MAKTVQALKINASVTLKADERKRVHSQLFDGTHVEDAGALSKVRVVYSHAIVARYDDPDYSARVTARIALIKAELEEIGEIENWYVVAGAVPVADAEVLPDPEAAGA